jgi:hypothetical protein
MHDHQGNSLDSSSLFDFDRTDSAACILQHASPDRMQASTETTADPLLLAYRNLIRIRNF